jgi:hypothetical protein
MTSAAATATAEPTTFEEQLINALTSDISADDLYTLVEETKLGIDTASNDAEVAKAMALDPLQSPDAGEARRSMEDAKFKADRLRSLLPRLQARLIDTGNHEDYLRWRKRFDPLKPKVDVAAAKLKAVYQKFAAELVPLLAESEKIDAEVAAVSSAKPYYAKEASNDGCYLRSVELTARGLDAFSTFSHPIMNMELPDFMHQQKLLWPPAPINYAINVVPVRPHPGSEWWQQQQAEDDGRRAEDEKRAAALHEEEGRVRNDPKLWRRG